LSVSSKFESFFLICGTLFEALLVTLSVPTARICNLFSVICVQCF